MAKQTCTIFMLCFILMQGLVSVLYADDSKTPTMETVARTVLLPDEGLNITCRYHHYADLKFMLIFANESFEGNMTVTSVQTGYLNQFTIPYPFTANYTCATKDGKSNSTEIVVLQGSYPPIFHQKGFDIDCLQGVPQAPKLVAHPSSQKGFPQGLSAVNCTFQSKGPGGHGETVLERNVTVVSLMKSKTTQNSTVFRCVLDPDYHLSNLEILWSHNGTQEKGTITKLENGTIQSEVEWEVPNVNVSVYVNGKIIWTGDVPTNSDVGEPATDKQNGGLGAMAGIAIAGGCVAAVALLVIIVICCRKCTGQPQGTFNPDATDVEMLPKFKTGGGSTAASTEDIDEDNFDPDAAAREILP